MTVITNMYQWCVTRGVVGPDEEGFELALSTSFTKTVRCVFIIGMAFYLRGVGGWLCLGLGEKSASHVSTTLSTTRDNCDFGSSASRSYLLG